MIKLSTLKPNPKNPRIIKDEKFKALVQSIKDFPKMMELRPVIIDDKNIVLGGNMRLKAIQELGMKEIPNSWVKKASDLTKKEKEQFIIKDNVGFGEWDWEMLGNEWEIDELEKWGLDVPDFVTAGEVLEDGFEADPPINPITKLGDVYELNQHRFSCGDSCDAAVVEKTLAGSNPILMVTDPPYGVNYDPTWRHEAGIINSRRQGKVKNDDVADWRDAYSLFKGDVIYVYHPAGDKQPAFFESIVAAGFEIIMQIIWVKQQFVFGRGDYHQQHEPIIYAHRKGKKHNWQGSRKETTVWNITSILQASKDGTEANKAVTHGTQKPIECMARPIRNNTYERESVYDPFLGSGTTIIAADQLNRACYGQEIDPAYCDLIVARYIKFKQSESSGTAIRIKRNGKDLSEKEMQQYLKQLEPKNSEKASTNGKS